MLRRGVAVLSIVGTAALLLDCGPDCDFDSACPEPFDVGEWCGTENCMVDGAPASCRGFAGCKLRMGESLAIPLSSLAAELGDRQQLRLGIFSGCNFARVSILDFIVEIDGVRGVLAGYDRDSYALYFGELPPDAQILTIRYGAGPACLEVAPSFVDAPCETAQPPPNCAL